MGKKKIISLMENNEHRIIRVCKIMLPLKKHVLLEYSIFTIYLVSLLFHTHITHISNLFCCIESPSILFFPLLDTTLVFFIFGSPEGYNSHEVMFY